uniref:Uncharacterized protein n=1 Tax=Cacopsylla melanoneura TaxID=428564 RepID=A0A8D8PXW0_9HEMI
MPFRTFVGPSLMSSFSNEFLLFSLSRQMTEESGLVSLGNLFDSPSNMPAADCVKGIVAEYLPSGWREWLVRDVISSPLELDPSTRNKLRFAIPSVRLLEAFFPKCRHVSEKKFKEVKDHLLSWPFGRALIFSPSKISIHLRGSEERHVQFVRFTDCFRDLCLSRSQVNKVLESMDVEACSVRSSEPGKSTDLESPPYEPLTPPLSRSLPGPGNGVSVSRGSVRQAHPSLAHHTDPVLMRQPIPPSTDVRMSALEKSVSSIQSEMKTLVAALRASAAPPQSSLPHSPECQESDMSDSSSEFSEDECYSPSPSHGPRLLPADDDPWGHSLVRDPEVPLDASFWDPMTKEKDPDIQEPSALLLSQGILCQRLGEAAWNRIRYADAEKKLKRGAMFQPLAMNSVFEKNNSPVDFALRQQERLLGTVCHGLLAQRKAFKDTLSNLVESCPAAKETVKECFFSEDSEFRSQSEALLQFVCGKRAEVISDRRKAVMPPDGVRTLQLINPSTSHLFDEDALAKWSASHSTSSVPRSRQVRKRPFSAVANDGGHSSKRPMAASAPEPFRQHRGSKSRPSAKSRGVGSKHFTSRQSNSRGRNFKAKGAF